MCVLSLCWSMTCNLDVWENQLESFPGRKQPAVHVWLNNTATCVLLFFLDPLRALQPESWTSHCLMFDFNLQRVTRFARRLQGCELPFRVQLESLQCVYSLLVLLLKPSWNCCSPDLFVTFFLLYLFMHFSISLFFFSFCLLCVYVLQAFQNNQKAFFWFGTQIGRQRHTSIICFSEFS